MKTCEDTRQISNQLVLHGRYGGQKSISVVTLLTSSIVSWNWKDFGSEQGQLGWTWMQCNNVCLQLHRCWSRLPIYVRIDNSCTCHCDHANVPYLEPGKGKFNMSRIGNLSIMLAPCDIYSWRSWCLIDIRHNVLSGLTLYCKRLNAWRLLLPTWCTWVYI